MAERQVGERLSEQAEQLAGWLRVHGPPSRERLDEIADFVDSLARQLAEAERENGNLRPLVKACLEYFEQFDRERTDGRTSPIIPRLKAALRQPDPPASPAEGSEAATEVEA